MVAMHGRAEWSAEACQLRLYLACSQILSETVPPEARAARVETQLDKQKLLYCERFAELLIDLLSQLPTRRFVRTLLEDKAILIKCRMSPLLEHPQGEFQQLLLGSLLQAQTKASLAAALQHLPLTGRGAFRQLWRAMACS